jgi:hypothetical protein
MALWLISNPSISLICIEPIHGIAFVAVKTYNAINPVFLKEATMKYLGHFSFIGYNEDEISHGLLSAVVTANDIDSATVQFHTLLDQKKSEAGLFDRLTFIFLEDIIEIRELPEEGFIAHCIRFEGEPHSFKSRSIPGITGDVCKSFRLDPEFAAGEEQAVKEIVPFMTIER